MNENNEQFTEKPSRSDTESVVLDQEPGRQGGESESGKEESVVELQDNGKGTSPGVVLSDKNCANMEKEVSAKIDTLLVDDHWTAETFDECRLHEALISQVQAIGWDKPTPVQGLCLPYTISGKDLAGFAQTGTGKTGVFLLTFAHKFLSDKTPSQKGPKCVIVTPTRELAIQIESDARALYHSLSISSMAVFGGINYEKQAEQIKQGIDLIVATPGRLKDYYQKKILSLEDCHTFVCDEADRMLDMGFISDVEYFLEKLEPKTQKLLFSATTNDQVKELAFEYLENPEYISINQETVTPANIEQYGVICDSVSKLRVMLGLLKTHLPDCAIIFTNTKMVAEWLHYKLVNNQLDVEIITGDLPQNKRINLINKIKKGQVKALIATDVASRGLHIAGVTHVYNFDLPDDAANYVHRIGRTARAGAMGAAYSLVCEDYGHNFQSIQELLGDSASVQISWHDEAYLQIEDKAGNPYKDPNFKGSHLDKFSSPRQGDKTGAKSRSLKESSHQERTQKPDRSRPGGQKKTPQKKRQKDKKVPENRMKTHPQNKKRTVPVRDKQPKSDQQITGKKIETTPQKVPHTISGMVKKLFGTIFGLKRKKTDKP